MPSCWWPLEEGRGVQEYAERAGVTQAVMTRILFALGSRSRGRERGYRKLDSEDVKLATHLVETLISFRHPLRRGD